jgi:hypothetical protein
MPSLTNSTTQLKLTVDGSPLTYAQLLKTVAVTAKPVINLGVVTFPPGLLVSEIDARSTLIAACDAATSTITLSESDKALALELVDAFYWGVSSSEIVAFRAALAASA